jgi:hypothetical protein
VLILFAVTMVGVGLQLARRSGRPTWPLWSTGVLGLVGFSLLVDSGGASLWVPLVAIVLLAASELVLDPVCPSRAEAGTQP